MPPAASPRQKCTYGAKCYRKSKQHKEEFWHPGDEEEDEVKDDTSFKTTDKPRLVHDISVTDDEEMPASKANDGKKRKRDNDNDDADSTSKSPSKVMKTDNAKNNNQESRKRKSGDEDGEEDDKPSTSSSPSKSPAKVMKFDNSKVEKITVDYTKKKASSSAAPAATSNDVDGAASRSSEAPKTIKYTSKRQKCKYWDKCYQSNENHLKEFYHPGDSSPADDEEKSKPKRGQNKTPLNPLEDAGSVQFDSGFTLKRDGDNYSCSCKGFLSQRAPINERTCKHLKEYNGEEFENSRVNTNAKPKAANIRQHIKVNLLLAHKYEEKSHDPIGWWISEKLDGVRAFWNGTCFYSRLGNAFYAPEWFTKDLPKDIHLDGELFGGRGEFQSTVSIVKTAESPKWKDIKYYVFDGPHMGKDPFEKRMNTIKEYFEDVQPEYAVFVDQTKCVDKTQLDQMLTRILNIGGEGLMIRQPKSVYEPTRSKTLLKIKKFYDAEAIVIGHEKGKGVNQNRCGALRCRMACGKEFSVGSGLTDKDRNRPPKVGSIITYKFQELSKGGSPRFPTYLGIRIDMTEPKDAEIRVVMDEDEA